VHFQRSMANMTRAVRGSRKHVLDWLGSPGFMAELNALLEPAPVVVPSGAAWMPLGHKSAREARLDTFGPRTLPHAIDWNALRKWWLKHERGNTPNWDFAATCEIESSEGILLIEAKANVPELGKAGKRLDLGATSRSRENHQQIGRAIRDAQSALEALVPNISISQDSHYQLANRLAFTWKLASMGLPTALVYLGFTHDSGIADAGEPFADAEHWNRHFYSHVGDTIPSSAFERRIATGAAPFWLLVRARKALSPSPPRSR